MYIEIITVLVEKIRIKWFSGELGIHAAGDSVSSCSFKVSGKGPSSLYLCEGMLEKVGVGLFLVSSFYLCEGMLVKVGVGLF